MAFGLRFPFSLGIVLAFTFGLALGLAFEGWFALAFWFAFAFAFWFAFALWLIRSGRDQARCGFLHIGPHTLVWDFLPFGFALPALCRWAGEAWQYDLAH